MTISSDTSISGKSTNSKNTGYVTADVGEGELFLRGPHHRVYRLKWKRGEQDQRRALPVGRYSITGYRVARKDEKGVPWFVSTTSHSFRRLVVRSGEVRRVKIDPTVHVGLKAAIHGEQLQAQMMIHGDRPGGGHMAGRHAGHHALQRIGLPIYRAGKRISIGYRALDGQGEVIASGTMQYG